MAASPSSALFRKKYVMANWKMNGDYFTLQLLVSDIKKNLALPVQNKHINNKNINNINPEIVIFPPFVYLESIASALQSTFIAWGGQNVSAYSAGAYTGEISAAMLKDRGCQYVLIGHSERRQYFYETNDILHQKLIQSLKAGLKPVLCVGETRDQRQAQETYTVIASQLRLFLDDPEILAQLASLIIAYEPVWAIGTGLSATPSQAQDMHVFIRRVLSEKDAVQASRVPILYGGSVTDMNAVDFFQQPDIDGALVGGASLKSEAFCKICEALSKN